MCLDVNIEVCLCGRSGRRMLNREESGSQDGPGGAPLGVSMKVPLWPTLQCPLGSL